ncbi:MAG: 4Fe-4S dicluster domain-containing protein [Deltaproteobacteria bacterium]|nr:4Fe-4S dicluster domain-containing protein [Deltaproteobacteria bacterium]MBW1955188.1 4Fe-4S dicluster domain-containing protein [Deltaproteobacteria bacterium]MBW2041346.1 4Fe-4S dicluster domain-containing protein [Deltaproteobacteria bacterium]MBW2131500.1 4Fe-4S dicluster domain-containing protein [Deltaproteobacteria bacterium]
MATAVKIDVKEQNLLGAFQGFFKILLELEDIHALLVPQQLPVKGSVMPTLVTDPDQLDGVDPLAPAFPLNAARVVSRLTRKPMGGKVVAVLRPCEIRAFIELVKLNQGSTEELILVGVDCLGAYSNADYYRLAGENPREITERFYQNVLGGKGTQMDGVDITAACKACEHPIPDQADLVVGLYGVDTQSGLYVEGKTPKGEDLIQRLGLPAAETPPSREGAIGALVAERTAYRDKMFADTREAAGSLDQMAEYFSHCINCYNCRVACPVCYCKECVFVTDVFYHEPAQYLKWSRRKGVIKMPTDTVFYHLTRLAHMSTACVGCGQCSNACPNDIPVMEVFRTMAHRTQQAFEYEAGKSLEEKPPLSDFREAEFEEVVGIS